MRNAVRFLFNQCEDNGGVLFATRNTRINIEGGLFYRNLAGVVSGTCGVKREDCTQTMMLRSVVGL